MKILIADDHALYRGALVQLVKKLDARAVALEAQDWDSALARAEQHPDLALALLDLAMPGMESFAGLAAFLDQAITTPVVVISGSENVSDMRRALDCGAMGYIAKSESVPIMHSALALVLSGGVYVPPRMMENPTDAMASHAQLGELSPQQLKVLQAIARGLSNKEIAMEMQLSVSTIKTHISALFRVLGVNKRFEAIRLTRETGLLR